ncbi:MAG: type I glyceraldehyde-3-phosphate dehydrogenase [Verrucomicrobia bacterium]|nr:type I glyceraldehyde-3-phosphate dehydrogenase [Verrucomicrobiota bacterium]MBS0647170.1 type I glyceraldehyde-3-phosphate dehydrogenase [Verrucomicrobiota bacterium]
MGVRVAINGLGRIGRLFLRQAILRKSFQVVAVNDLVPPDNLAYLIKHDSTHGLSPFSVQAYDHHMTLDGSEIAVYNERKPELLPWKQHQVDIVIEATGLFTDIESAQKHLEAGAKRVIISAPAKGDHIPTFVMGVNHTDYQPKTHQVVSNASCTTNCLAPMTKVLLDRFGIEEGLMTTIHATTATQPTVDGSSKKDWRGGRGALQNLIPASTGAAKAVGLCLPDVKGKLTGMAFRVPVACVSAVDLTVRLSRATSYDAICQAMQEAANRDMKGILGYCDEEVVSSDFIGSTLSCAFDAKAGIALNDRFYKLIAWYDNEMGYSMRLVDLVDYMASKE